MSLSCFHVPFLIFSVTNPKPILCGLTLEISWNSKVGIHDLVQVATGKVYAEFLTCVSAVWFLWWMVQFTSFHGGLKLGNLANFIWPSIG